MRNPKSLRFVLVEETQPPHSVILRKGIQWTVTDYLIPMPENIQKIIKDMIGTDSLSIAVREFLERFHATPNLFWDTLSERLKDIAEITDVDIKIEPLSMRMALNTWDRWYQMMVFPVNMDYWATVENRDTEKVIFSVNISFIPSRVYIADRVVICKPEMPRTAIFQNPVAPYPETVTVTMVQIERRRSAYTGTATHLGQFADASYLDFIVKGINSFVQSRRGQVIHDR